MRRNRRPRTQSARCRSLLAERDWLVRVNSEFASPLRQLGPRLVVRALHHATAAAEPLLCVRLYLWPSRFGQHFAQDRSVRRALGDALWQRGPMAAAAGRPASTGGGGDKAACLPRRARYRLKY
ncbi:unnamed protein product [Miscanthus lutarioriparius]|uniref:Uncharacterized protein n=1 Tax=Miscanthus lutarioriparius TaxID=422564 RepID=A0A811QGG1_9POAL|nr:unnamed protein product [Miscanthus lutarioriparius]